NPVSQPFCGTCNRIRLTADGQLRTCLFSVEEWDLRRALRDGGSDEDLSRLLTEAVAHKELKHKINEGAQFERASRSMSQIGGEGRGGSTNRHAHRRARAVHNTY